MERETLLAITVDGKPEPQGSVKAFVPTYRNGSPVRREDGSIVVNLTSDNPALKEWRRAVSEVARVEMRGVAPKLVPVEVEAIFHLERPKAHCGTGRNEGTVKDSAPAWPSVRPDVDKLLRAVLDALSEVVFADDSQVVLAIAEKRYCHPSERPGAQIVVRAAPGAVSREPESQLALA